MNPSSYTEESKFVKAFQEQYRQSGMSTFINLTHIAQKSHIQYHIVTLLNKSRIISTLVDTAACFSYISSKLVDSYRIIQNPIEFIGLDERTHTLERETTINLEFTDIITQKTLEYTLNIFVTETHNHNLVLGTDFLESIKYVIRSEYIEIEDIKITRIKLPDYTLERII